MTIVGTAEIAINAGTTQFPSQLAAGVNPALAQTDTKMRASAANAKKAWGSAASGIAGAFQSQLGPVQGMLTGIGRSLKDHGAVAGTLLGAGSGALAAGVAGSALGSSEQAAMQSLQQAVTNTGKSWADYSGRADEAVKQGENMAFSSKDTLNALTTLTVMLHSPTKALASLGFAMNIARKNHIDLASAASLAGRANLGLARGLLPLGVNISADNKLVTAATVAQKAHAAAVVSLQAKKRALAQEEQRINAAPASSPGAQARQVAAIKSAEAALSAARFSHGAASPQYAAAEARLAAARASTATATGPTVSEEIALSNARKAVSDAQKKVAATTDAMHTANTNAKGAQDQINNATDQAKKNVDGLAAAHVHTFGGQFDVWKTKIEDQTAILGHEYGPALIGVGVGLQGLGALYSTGAAIIGRYRGAQDAAKTAAAETTIAVEAETTAMSEEGLAGAVAGVETELGNLATSASPAKGALSELSSSGRSSMGRLGGAVIGVAGLIGSYEEGKHNAGGSATSATLMGAVTGAVAGFASGFGPAGAIVGAVAGGTAALIGHMHRATAAIDGADQAVLGFSRDLTAALEAGGKGGALGVIGQYLTKNPATTKALAQAGITAADVRDYLIGRSTGKLKDAQQQAGYNKVANFVINNFSGGLNGQGTVTITKDTEVARLLIAMLKAIGPALSQAKDYQQVVHPRRGHRAGGGDVYPGQSYIVGEHGPEVLQMGDRGRVYSHNGVGPGRASQTGDGQSAMYQLRLINGVDRLITAVEDTPHGITRELTRATHQLRSPELASL